MLGLDERVEAILPANLKVPREVQDHRASDANDDAVETAAALAATGMLCVSTVANQPAIVVITESQVIFLDQSASHVLTAAPRTGMRVLSVPVPISTMVMVYAVDGSSVRLEWPFLNRKQASLFQRVMSEHYRKSPQTQIELQRARITGS
jgi:hypothetical protein